MMEGDQNWDDEDEFEEVDNDSNLTDFIIMRDED